MVMPFEQGAPSLVQSVLVVHKKLHQMTITNLKFNYYNFILTN